MMGLFATTLADPYCQGHSLGGAVASIGGLSLKSNFPNATVKVYTFGQSLDHLGSFALTMKTVSRST